MARNATQAPQEASQHEPRPWDTPGLPARAQEDRCRWHDGHCAYRDDDPNRCTLCHATNTSNKCTCEHGPLTIDHTDRIRNEYLHGGHTLKELATAHNISTGHLVRLLKGIYNRVRDAALNPENNTE